MHQLPPKGLWIIMASGTGGHVIPALAMAEALQQQGYRVRWLGTPDGIEHRLLKDTLIPIDPIPMKGLRGKGLWRWLMAPYILLSAFWAAIRLFRKHKPIAVLGLGGFVTGPGGLAAYCLRIPLVIQEQNAIPGLANRLLKPFAKRVMVAFPNTFKSDPKIRVTGNPIRVDILAVKPYQPTGLPLKLLVMGGSLGAKNINDAVQQFCLLYPNKQLDIWHQTGAKDFERIQSLYALSNLQVYPYPFINDMAEAYEWADVVLCRAGAMTVFELAAVGRASILVPYPYAVDDHQTANARYLCEQEAALLMPESTLTPQALDLLFKEWIKDPQKIINMSKGARALASPNTTLKMVNICLEVCSL